jgi:hypothetical protein
MEKFAAMIVTDLLTGKRVSRAHIWRMDQILPAELSAFELIGHDKGAPTLLSRSRYFEPGLDADRNMV